MTLNHTGRGVIVAQHFMVTLLTQKEHFEHYCRKDTYLLSLVFIA